MCKILVCMIILSLWLLVLVLGKLKLVKIGEKKHEVGESDEEDNGSFCLHQFFRKTKILLE